MEDLENSLDAFNNLNENAIKRLVDINDQILARTGEWGETKSSEMNDDGSIEMPYVVKDPLILEFLEFMYDNDLVIVFDWANWDEGREWYKSTDQSKYEKLDAETALKLLTAVIRNDRFHEGALVNVFKSGDFPKIINRLVELKASSGS